jgi:hypothetical protein
MLCLKINTISIYIVEIRCKFALTLPILYTSIINKDMNLKITFSAILFLFVCTSAYCQNVGIGTALPLTKLHLKSTSSDSSVLTLDNTSTTYQSGINMSGCRTNCTG